MSKKTITDTEVDNDVVERLYHTKDMQKLLDEVLEDYPKLTFDDIIASLQYAADREHKTTLVKISA